jgi:hypothetical protein
MDFLGASAISQTPRLLSSYSQMLEKYAHPSLPFQKKVEDNPGGGEIRVSLDEQAV